MIVGKASELATEDAKRRVIDLGEWLDLLISSLWQHPQLDAACTEVGWQATADQGDGLGSERIEMDRLPNPVDAHLPWDLGAARPTRIDDVP